MIRHISVAAISILIGACASSGPEAPAPADTASPAGIDAVASDKPSDPPEDDFYALENDGVPKTASASPENRKNEIVCQRERPAGSKMMIRTCRSRAEIDATAAEAQQALHEMRSVETASQNAMQGQR